MRDDEGIHRFDADEVDELARMRGVLPVEVPGYIASRVFRCFELKMTLAQIVIEHGVSPEQVRVLYRQYMTPLGAEDPHARERREESEHEKRLTALDSRTRRRRSG